MKSKFKLVGMILLLTISIGFSSCMDDNGNFTTRSGVSGIVVATSPEVIINTGNLFFGRISVPELQGQVNINDYLYLTIKIDFDNQPASSSFNYEASLIDYTSMKHTPLIISYRAFDPEYNDSILGFTNGGGTETADYVDKRLMMRMWQNAPENQEYEYQLVCNPDSTIVLDNNKIYSLYLLAKKTGGEKTGTAKVFSIPYGFDASGWVSQFGSDNVLRFYVKYMVNTDKQGNPIYKLTSSKPYELNIENGFIIR